jgi:hypothetical protein
MDHVLVAVLAGLIASVAVAWPAIAAEKGHTNANLAFRSGGSGSQGGGQGGRTATFPFGYQTTGGSGIERTGGNCAKVFGQFYSHGKGCAGPEPPGG